MDLNARSLERLRGVHPELVRVVERAAQNAEQEFIVTEGVRTTARQSEMVKIGASRTMQSRHLTGHAVDLAPLVGGEVRWDWPLFYPLAACMKAAATECGVAIVWGGDWITWKDGPHFEIDPRKYPWPQKA